MELFLLHHAEWESLYNCTGLDINTVPLEKRRQFVPEAWATIVLCAIYYVLYVPCLVSIKRHSRGNACYQLLLYIGVMDLAVLWILGFLHGWLSLQGAVFCSYPVLIYLTGLGADIFIAESSADLVLAINRCVELISPVVGKKLFGGYRMVIWLGLCTIYGIYWIVFYKPVVFSSIYFAWFFDPFIGYREDARGEFSAPVLHGIHDMTLAIGSPLIYLIFIIIAIVKKYKMHDNAKMTPAQKMVFLQVFLISIINAVPSTLYVIMQHITPSQWMITLAQFGWFHVHGFPPIIYLTLNKTIRKDCRKMLPKWLRRRNVVIHFDIKIKLESVPDSKNKKITVNSLSGNQQRLASRQ